MILSCCFLIIKPEKIRTSNRLIRRDVAGYFIEPLGHLFGKLDRPTQRVFITNPNYGLICLRVVSLIGI